MSTNSENIYFYKGLEENLPKTNIKVGALYHCTDTKNTYIGLQNNQLDLYSTVGAQVQIIRWEADD